MAYTKIPKPTATVYSNVNIIGKQQYDEPSLIYDDPSTFYDGIDFGAYTKVGKPVGTSYTNIPKPI